MSNDEFFKAVYHTVYLLGGDAEIISLIGGQINGMSYVNEIKR
jgi:hypothetical protein